MIQPSGGASQEHSPTPATMLPSASRQPTGSGHRPCSQRGARKHTSSLPGTPGDNHSPHCQTCPPHGTSALLKWAAAPLNPQIFLHTAKAGSTAPLESGACSPQHPTFHLPSQLSCPLARSSNGDPGSAPEQQGKVMAIDPGQGTEQLPEGLAGGHPSRAQHRQGLCHRKAGIAIAAGPAGNKAMGICMPWAGMQPCRRGQQSGPQQHGQPAQHP